MTAVILDDAAEDSSRGAQSHDSCATDVGDYFLDSNLSDLESLVLFAGVHQSILDSIGCCRKRFPRVFQPCVVNPRVTTKHGGQT